MWQNRIIGAGTENPKNLIPNPKNWRKHPKNQAQALEGVLEEIGWLQDIIINQRTGRLIDGHLRVELAIRNKEKSVPVKYVDLSEEEEEKAIITLDPITSMAEADKEILAQLLQSVTSDNQKVKDLLLDIGYRYDQIKFNPMDEWKEMPEFNQENILGYKSLTVHFETKEDFQSFCKVIGQDLSEKTKYTWFPQKEKANLKDLRYENES